MVVSVQTSRRKASSFGRRPATAADRSAVFLARGHPEESSTGDPYCGAAFAAAGAIGIGGIGCWVGGILGDRWDGPARPRWR